MKKKSVIIVYSLILLFVCQLTFAVNGPLFIVSAAGNQTTAPINIILCLNGKGPLSCQSFTVSNPRLTISTTIPEHTYVAAGIKISSTKAAVTNLEGCVPYSNGFCLFSVSNSQPARIFINNPTATPIVFLSHTQTQGDMSNNSQTLTGTAGANAICNADAQIYGTPAVKAHSNYTALLITSSLTPCSQINNVNGCAGPYATPQWPLKPGTTYFNPDGITPFNTVTSNAIFPDTSPQGLSYPDLTYPDGTTPPIQTPFWFGPMSIFLNETPTAITGWAYANLANSPDYDRNFSLCTLNGGVEPGLEWMSQNSSYQGAYGMTALAFHCGSFNCGATNAWQNYYTNNIDGEESDTFSAADWHHCNADKGLLCVSSP